MPIATVTFEMKDGRELSVKYGYSYTPATYHDPADYDLGDPSYFIDGKEVSYEQLPKGLGELADVMYENGEYDERFTYSVESDPEPDYEPDEPYSDY